MYRISHGSINTTTRRESTLDLSKKITTCNMNGTINATSRRDLLTQKDGTEHGTEHVTPVDVTPKPTPVRKPTPTPAPKIVANVASDNTTRVKLNEIEDQYVKISMSLNHINKGSNNIKKDLNAYKKVTDDHIENLSNSQKQTSNELNDYKKLTDERIEKIANLFLSINK